MLPAINSKKSSSCRTKLKRQKTVNFFFWKFDFPAIKVCNVGTLLRTSTFALIVIYIKCMLCAMHRAYMHVWRVKVSLIIICAYLLVEKELKRGRGEGVWNLDFLYVKKKKKNQWYQEKKEKKRKIELVIWYFQLKSSIYSSCSIYVPLLGLT